MMPKMADRKGRKDKRLGVEADKWKLTKVGLNTRLTGDLRGPNFLARDISSGI